MPSEQRARQILADDRIVWYQRLEVAPGLWSPGAVEPADMMRRAQMPEDMSGLSVLDVGTSNGGVAFEAERRGAERVVAVDIYDPDWFGFSALAEHFGSNASYIRATVYELPEVLDGTFDLVVCFGLLYHLRHPLLGLDAARRLSRGWVFIESTVADAFLPESIGSSEGIVRFFRGAELTNDSSNWFAPTAATLLDWCRSAGLDPELVDAQPTEGRPERCIVKARRTDGEPEYETLSYEVPLQVRADLTPVPDRRH